MRTELPERPGGPVASPPHAADGDAPSHDSAHPTMEVSTPAPANPVRRYGPLDVILFPPRLVMRIFFPRLVDRYVIGELLGPLAFGWTLFLALVVFGFYLFKLATAAARGAPLPMVTEMLWLRTVLNSVICIPMAMLLAGLLAFGRLSGDSELVAMQAAGIRSFRVLRNAIWLGLILSFVGLGMNEYVLPRAGLRLHHIESQVKAMLKAQAVSDFAQQNAFIIQDFERGKLARLVAAKKFEPAHLHNPAMLDGVTFIEYDDRGAVGQVIQADQAEYVQPDESAPGRQIWRFPTAFVQTMAAPNKAPTQRWAFHARDLEFTLNKSPQQVQEDEKDATEMTFRELSAYIERLKVKGRANKTVRELEVTLQQKLAIPFAALVLALVGAPLGIRRQRSTAAVGVGISVIIVVLYYIGNAFLQALGQNGAMHPVAAAWGCNVVALVAGLILTWRAS